MSANTGLTPPRTGLTPPRTGLTPPRTHAHARNLLAPGVVAACAAAAAGAVLLRDPHVPGSWGTCTILSVTGYYCPGCGGLRAVNDLMHGNLPAALSSNALVVLIVLLCLAGWVAWVRARWSARPFVVSGLRDGWVLAATLGGLAAFTVLRNTPFLAVLAP